MKIGIVGAGKIGGTLQRLFTQAGHESVAINSRGPMTADELAHWGDIIILAAHFRHPEALPSSTAVRGKVVVDAMNPYDDNFEIMDLGDSTSSEETAKRLPDARLVKAFNTIYYVRLGANGDTSKPRDEREAIFVAGDDPEAKAQVANLIDEIGFAPVDTGTLRAGGRRQEPGAELYNRELTGAEATRLVQTSA